MKFSEQPLLMQFLLLCIAYILIGIAVFAFIDWFADSTLGEWLWDMLFEKKEDSSSG